MRKISLRNLLSKLTLATIAVAVPATAAPADAAPNRGAAIDDDACDGCEADLDADVPIDRGNLDSRDAAATLGRALAIALSEVPPLSATHLATTWALSIDPVRRLALGHALEWTFPLVGADVVIDHLSRDADPQIRIAAAHAAWVRRASGGDPGVLGRLVSDPDPEVRAVALRAM